MSAPADGIDRSDTTVWCPCGSRRREGWFWHRTGNHDCIHHRVDRCKVCAMFRGVTQMLIESAAAHEDGE